MPTTKLGKFKLREIASCASIALIGKRRSGKSTWAKYMAKYMLRRLQRVVVLVGNKEGELDWGKVIPPTFVHAPDTKYLEATMQYQRNLVTTNGRIHDSQEILIVMDDCGFDKEFMTGDALNELIMNGRHYGVTLLMCLQHLYQLAPVARSNMDYFCIIGCPSNRDIIKLSQEYASCYTTKQFREIVKQCTSPQLVTNDSTRKDDTSDEERDDNVSMERLRTMCVINNTQAVPKIQFKNIRRNSQRCGLFLPPGPDMTRNIIAQVRSKMRIVSDQVSLEGVTFDHDVHDIGFGQMMVVTH
jgi:hypothetical protein